MNFKIVVFLFAGIAVDLSAACNGYKAKVVKLESCGGADQVISVDDGFTIELTKDCELVPKGCISNKAFNTAKVTYSVMKDGIPVKEGTADLCEAAGSATEEAKNMMKVFAMPDHCPVVEGKICAKEDTKADLSKYKNLLSMAKGNIVINSNIEHDTGKTCFHTELEITK